jgi:hypothetical protein
MWTQSQVARQRMKRLCFIWLSVNISNSMEWHVLGKLIIGKLTRKPVVMEP